MKHLLLVLVLMTLPLAAQEQNADPIADTQAREWMNKISSDAEMSNTMILKILEATKDNREEMKKLGKTLMDNPGMNSVLTEMTKTKKSEEAKSFGMMSDSVRTMKMVPIKK